MIALFRLATVTEDSKYSLPITEWTDDLASLLEGVAPEDRQGVLVERIAGDREVAEVPDETWEEVDSKNEGSN